MSIKNVPTQTFTSPTRALNETASPQVEVNEVQETNEVNENSFTEDGFQEAPVTQTFSNASTLNTETAPVQGNQSTVLGLMLNRSEEGANTVAETSVAAPADDFAGAVPVAGKLERIYDDEVKDDSGFDGAFVGADKIAYTKDSDISMVPPVVPSDGSTPNGLIMYVNGIRSDKNEHFDSMQELADSTGAAVVGVHNSTSGGVFDVMEAIGDKLDWGKNHAAETLTDNMYAMLKNSDEVIHVHGHSQGGLIVARAIKHLKSKLQLEDGLSETQVEEKLKNIHVNTYGPACRRFPDGPCYTHYVNKHDSVVQRFGLGLDSATPGKDATVHYFEKDGDGLDETHSFSVYMNLKATLQEKLQSIIPGANPSANENK